GQRGDHRLPAARHVAVVELDPAAIDRPAAAKRIFAGRKRQRVGFHRPLTIVWPMNLREMKIVVTGAAQGMGAHFARRLHEAGAQVAAGDVNEAGLKELPAGVHTRKLNVADEAECGSFIAWAHEAMGGCNGLVNNAGILRDGLLVKKDKTTGAIQKLSAEQW